MEQPDRLQGTLLKLQLNLEVSNTQGKQKRPVKLMQRVKIDHSFLQSVSNLFHFIVLSLPMQFYIWLSKNFSEPTSKNGEIDRFNLENQLHCTAEFVSKAL